MTAIAQGVLFEKGAEPAAPPHESARGWHGRKRGRGALELVTFTWTAPHPNPRGRRRLTFRFRPLRRHERPLVSDGRPCWVVASELLQEYFMALGGFATASRAIVRAWADLLLPSQAKPGGGTQYTPDELRRAISAKAAVQQGKTAGEQDRKRAFLGHVATFPERVGYWLDLADREARKRLVGDNDDLRARLDGIRRPVASSVPPRVPVAVIADAAADRSAAFEGHMSDALVRINFNRRVWRATRSDRQALIERALREDFAEYLRAFAPAADPSDARFGPLWLSWRVDESIRRYGFPSEASGRVASAAMPLFPFMDSSPGGSRKARLAGRADPVARTVPKGISKTV